MASYRLKPEHPVAKKIDKLFAFLEKENLTINHGYDGLYVTDDKTGKKYAFKDVESGIGDAPLSDIPAQFEYKLTFED